jgi:gamma-glutamyltranspeptidase/glutathione hydrolase
MTGTATTEEGAGPNTQYVRLLSRMRVIVRTYACTALAACFTVLAPGQAPAQSASVENGFRSAQDRIHPVFGTRGMVSSQEARATAVGIDILQQGGNAVDAAVAVGFALAVTLPRAGNIGGGGFMLVHLAGSGKTVALDYRETAPKSATRKMFLKSDGTVDRDSVRNSHRSVGVPGTVAGLTIALRRYGTMPLEKVMAPAIRFAAEGILVSRDMAHQLKRRAKRLAKVRETKRLFFGKDGKPLNPGDRLLQSDLAESLKSIAKGGATAFYKGEIARRIVADMKANKGLMSAQDLADYRAVIREPVHGRYRGYDIHSMPPPSSGGIHLVQILNILEGYDLAKLGPNSAASIHRMAEAMKRAYADRSEHLGDPAFWTVPVKGLMSKKYAAALRQGIKAGRATPAREIGPGKPQAYESNETTHFTVMDRFGNAVSNTYTLNFGYGSGIVAKGTGILLNNEMADFAAKPGVPNAFGLMGGEANAVDGGKRPLSSMSPTIVLRDGKPFLATGSPGGSRIITTVLQLLVNVLDHRMNIAEATHAPRFHHQWLPDKLRLEEGFSRDTIRPLRKWGHNIEIGRPMGSLQSVMRTKDGFLGASDPRRPDALTLGF